MQPKVAVIRLIFIWGSSSLQGAQAEPGSLLQQGQLLGEACSIRVFKLRRNSLSGCPPQPVPESGLQPGSVLELHVKKFLFSTRA